MCQLTPLGGLLAVLEDDPVVDGLDQVRNLGLMLLVLGEDAKDEV